MYDISYGICINTLSTEADEFFILKTYTDLWRDSSLDLSYFFPLSQTGRLFWSQTGPLQFSVAQVFGVAVTVLFIIVSFLWSVVA